MLRNKISAANRMKFYIADEELLSTQSVQRFYDKERRQTRKRTEKRKEEWESNPIRRKQDRLTIGTTKPIGRRLK